MTEKLKVDGNIYIDSKTGNAIVVKKTESDSYSFYATKLIKNENHNDIDFEHLQPIDDIFDYIDENNLDINVYSKKMEELGVKKNGK